MICISCDSDNPPGRSTCTTCRQPLNQAAKSDHIIAKTNQSFVPKLLSREPGSPLYVIVDPENFEKTSFWGKKKETTEVNPHGLDLSTLDKSSWAELFTRIIEKNTSFALSSYMSSSLDKMLDLNGVRDKIGLFMLGSKELHLEFPDAPNGLANVLDLPILKIDEAVEVAYDFFLRPSELLDLHNWIPFDNTPQSPSDNSSQTSYVAPITTTTFIATDGFEF
jgi:hypothetical protein